MFCSGQIQFLAEHFVPGYRHRDVVLPALEIDGVQCRLLDISVLSVGLGLDSFNIILFAVNQHYNRQLVRGGERQGCSICLA